MTDINFPITEAVSPESAIAETITYTTGLDVNNKVLLGDTTMKINSSGEITTDVFLDNIIDTSIVSTVQIVAGNGAVTIDLTKGTIIRLIISANTTITFTGLPISGYIKAIEIKVIHDSTNNVYTIGFTQTLLKEGGAPLIFTNTVSSQDNIQMLITEDGKLYSRAVINNLKATGTARESEIIVAPKVQESRSGERQAATPKNKTGYVDPRVAGVQPGALISCMADGTLNSTDIICDGFNRITSQVEIVNCIAQNQSYSIAMVENTAGTITLDLGLSRFFYLNQSADVTTINITNTSIDTYSIAFLFRFKDATSTPRLINFDPALFDWEMEPVLTQTASAIDLILIQSFAGVNTLVVLNNFS